MILCGGDSTFCDVLLVGGVVTKIIELDRVDVSLRFAGFGGHEDGAFDLKE